MTASNVLSQRIQENYRIESMTDRVRQALEKAGLGSGPALYLAAVH